MLDKLLENYPQDMSLEAAVEAGSPYYFDEKEAAGVLFFFEQCLRHSKGSFANEPFKPLEWQKAYLTTLFGWKSVETGLRRFKTSYLSTAKKQGKSTLLAGVAIYLTMADRERSAEVYSVAADVAQASIVYREAESMVNASAALRSRLEITASRRNIADPKTNSFYRVLPGEGFRTEGINAHAICFDELHAQRDRRLYDALRFSGVARRQSLFLATTTAGYDKQSICYEVYSYAKNVLADPDYDPTFLPFICEPRSDDWESEEAWRDSNPSYGVTVDPEGFENDYREAKRSLTKENAFRRYRVNQWVHQENRFLNMDCWHECNLPPVEPLEGRDCWVGLDLATTFDTSAMVAVFPDEDGFYDVLCRFWIPADNAQERELRDRLPYSSWLKDKKNGLTTTPGNVTDYDFIRRDINDFGRQYRVKKILIDRWNSTQLAIQLSGDGFEVQGYSQTYGSMSAPTKHLENLVISKKIRHNGNHVLTYMAGAVSVKQDPAGNIRPVKPAHGSAERIDGIVALIMALGGHTGERPEPSKMPQIIVI